jgi:aspartyl protease family protein
MKGYKYFIVFVLTLMIASSFNGCGGCSKSGLKDKSNRNSRSSTQSNDFRTSNSQGKTIVKMETESGVKYIWIEINGLRLKFIFDTGASSICISAAEATVLYRQGTLRKEDILDIQYFQDATGKVSAGTRINLRTVKIGNRVLQNIEATVIDNNEAPLLLGQSALEKFGKISIDNKNNVIIFE